MLTFETNSSSKKHFRFTWESSTMADSYPALHVNLN